MFALLALKAADRTSAGVSRIPPVWRRLVDCRSDLLARLVEARREDNILKHSIQQ
jgi:hypothetical protein